MAPSSQISNGNGKSSNTQGILVAISVIFSIIFTCLNAFWSLANPKDDIKSIESRLQTEIIAVEARLDHQITEVKDSIRDLKTESKENTKESAALTNQRLESINQNMQMQLIELQKQVSDALTAKGGK